MYKYISIHTNKRPRNQDYSNQGEGLVGDIEADNRFVFSHLYDQYAPALLGVIRTILPDKAASEAALERTFLTVHAQIETYKPGKELLFTWLLTIARRTAIEARKNYHDVVPDKLSLSETGKVLAGDNRKNQPVTGPGSQQKELIDSVLLKNCTPEEAALSLDIPVAEARQQLRLAVQQLLRPKKS